MKQLITYFIAFVWLINGIYCKVLNQAPRHQDIVSTILGDDYAREITFFIGCLEVILAIAIVIKFKPKLLAVFQVIIIITMNCIELLLAKDLLLFGNYNMLLALIFCIIILLNEFKNA